jgi:hypothetical protein
MAGNRLSSLSGTPKITGIDSADCVLRQPVHQPCELLTALLIEFRIRMATEPASLIGFSMANKEKMCHTLQTPQK